MMDRQVVSDLLSMNSFEALDILLHRLSCDYSLQSLLDFSFDLQFSQLRLQEVIDILDQLQKSSCSKEPHRQVLQRKSKVDSWLFVNGLTISSAREILNRAKSHVSDDDSVRSSRPVYLLCADSAWELAANALSERLPTLSDIVCQIFNHARKDLSPSELKHPLPFTHDMGWMRLPYISTHYKGTPSDLLCIAHEMAHAIQIVASQRENGFFGYDMPSVARETCAFIGELMLLKYLKDISHPLYESCQFAWEFDSKAYCIADKSTLLEAFEGNEVKFNYRWNYPIARILSTSISKQNSSDQIGCIFSAGQLADVPFLENTIKGYI